jgi:hypothetical protein
MVAIEGRKYKPGATTLVQFSMLPKHPDQYSDESLQDWIRHLVDERVPEGPRLDYKAAIGLSSDKERREAAKDISSFANEIGGVLAYGIPEERHGVDTATPTEPYGIDPFPGLEQRLENVYVDAIRPSLPEWRIRRVELSEFPGKVVYLVWTPESWLGPHMVEAYGDRRYYRRGQLRAVEMAEHEVRSRYERMARRLELADSVVSDLDSEALSSRFDDPCGSHYLAYPLAAPYRRIDFTTVEMQQWLRSHPYPPNQWLPAVFGVQTVLEENPARYTAEPWSPYARMTHYGAFSVWRHTAVNLLQGSKIPEYIAYVSEFREVWAFLSLAAQLFQRVEYFGPVRVCLRFRAQRVPLRIPPARGHPVLEYQGPSPLKIEVDAPASAFLPQPEGLFKRLADEFSRAFGIWEAEWVTADGNLVR